MVLIGRPSLNAASRWLQRQAAVEKTTPGPPVTFLRNGSGYRIGGCAHRAAGEGHNGRSTDDGGLAIGFVAPLPSTAIRFSYSVGGAEAGRLALVLDGVSLSALRSLVKFSFSSNQALTRAAFTNLWPDYMLVGPDFGARGYGGVLEAGFWYVAVRSALNVTLPCIALIGHATAFVRRAGAHAGRKTRSLRLVSGVKEVRRPTLAQARKTASCAWRRYFSNFRPIERATARCLQKRVSRKLTCVGTGSWPPRVSWRRRGFRGCSAAWQCVAVWACGVVAFKKQSYVSLPSCLYRVAATAIAGAV